MTAFIASLCASLFCAAFPAILWAQERPVAPGDNTKPDVLVNPSGRDLALIAYHLAGAQPPCDSWANADSKISQLDEFNRPDAIKRFVESCQRRSTALDHVQDVRVQTGSTFGEYNSQYGEFDLQIDDGTSIDFNTFPAPTPVSIHLINGSLAQAWPLSASEARTVLSVTKGSRYVLLVMSIHLKSSELGDGSDRVTLDGKVVDYDIENSNGDRRLGHVTVK
jgi:hypothetical protein